MTTQKIIKTGFYTFLGVATAHLLYQVGGAQDWARAADQVYTSFAAMCIFAIALIWARD